jgi:hypothetical protein
MITEKGRENLQESGSSHKVRVIKNNNYGGVNDKGI